MGRPRRFYRKNRLYFATARTVSGLPFVPDEFGNELLEGILANAQQRYPITICHYLFMGNHFHILLRCNDAQTTANFFSYLKGEIARAMNKLTGRRGEFWHARTDTPLVVGESKILQTITYIYTNPQHAGLVSSIEDYPGLSSWRYREREVVERRVPRYRIRDLRKIPNTVGESQSRRALLEQLRGKEEQEFFTLRLEPQAWRGSCVTECTKQEALQGIQESVLEQEREIASEREYPPIGARRLQVGSMYRVYRPKKYGKRVFVLCNDTEVRRACIRAYKAFCKVCREVYLRWKQGGTEARFPPGAFPPAMIPLANAI